MPEEARGDGKRPDRPFTTSWDMPKYTGETDDNVVRGEPRPKRGD